MYTVIINKKFIRRTFVSSILFCWSLMFPIAVIQRTSASTSFFIWKSKTKLIFPLKCIHFLMVQRWLTIAFYAFIYHLFTWKTTHNTKHTIQYKKKGLKTSFFFFTNYTKVCAHVSSTLANKNQRRSTKVHAHKPFLFPSLETL